MIFIPVTNRSILSQENREIVMKITSSIANNFLSIDISGQIVQGELSGTIKRIIDEASMASVKDASLYINSEGGSVFEAQEVVNELKRLRSVSITVGSLAASAATYIMTFFPSVALNSTSQFMIHKPSTYVTGNEDEVKADIKALENITNSYRTAYAKKFNKSEDEIEQLWKNDYWMTAKEALAIGLIDSIKDEEIKIDEEIISMMVACGAPTIPTKTINNKNNMDLKILAQAVGKPEISTESELISAINSLKQNSKDWETKYNALKNTESTKLVDKAVALGLIPESLKAAQIVALDNDYENQSKIIAKLIEDKEAEDQKENRNGIIETVVASGKGQKPSASGEESFDYLQKNDPIKLAKIRAEEPVKYAQLSQAYAQGARWTPAQK